MRAGRVPKTLGIIWLICLPAACALAQESVLVSSEAGECTLSVELNQKWQTLRLRSHHPRYRDCAIGKDSMLSILKAAFMKIEPPAPDGSYPSLSIGRLIDYPWLTIYLATTAYGDPGWDRKRGKPTAMDINKYVAQLLFRREIIAQLDGAFENSGIRIAGVSVEKVLVGSFREVPSYQGEMHTGRIPFDAQVWFRLAKK
jgi:hypothetical protein